MKPMHVLDSDISSPM